MSVYGPFATLLQSLTSHLGGANLRETVWCWQVLVVLAWLAVRFLLLRAGATARRVDTLWTLNPLVFGVGVLGAHVDLVAAALGVAALVLAARSPLAAGLFAGLAVSCKITYGVVGLAVLLGWWVHERAGFVRRTVCVRARGDRRRRPAPPLGRPARLRPARPRAQVDLARDPVAAALRGR